MLDVPPPPKILTTRIKTKLMPTPGTHHTHQMYPPHRKEVAECRGGSIAATRGQRSRPLADSPIVLSHSLPPYGWWVGQNWAITCLMQVHHWRPGPLVAPTTSSAAPLLSSACPALIHEGSGGSPCTPQLSVGRWKFTPPLCWTPPKHPLTLVISHRGLGLTITYCVLPCNRLHKCESPQGLPKRALREPASCNVKKYGLHHHHINFCHNTRRNILCAQDLAYACPRSPGFAQLIADCLDIIVVQQKQAAEVFENLNLL